MESNKFRNIELKKDIEKLALIYVDGLGISNDGKWSEDSFFIENISIEKANELAKKYGQLAFVFGYKNNNAALTYTK